MQRGLPRFGMSSSFAQLVAASMTRANFSEQKRESIDKLQLHARARKCFPLSSFSSNLNFALFGDGCHFGTNSLDIIEITHYVTYVFSKPCS